MESWELVLMKLDSVDAVIKNYELEVGRAHNRITAIDNMIIKEAVIFADFNEKLTKFFDEHTRAMANINERLSDLEHDFRLMKNKRKQRASSDDAKKSKKIKK